MEPKQILSSSLLDIIFEKRNKDYGAYELRATYPNRIKRSLLIVFIVMLLAFSGITFANSFSQKETTKPVIPDVTIIEIPPDVKQPEPLPEPEKKKPPQEQIRTEKYTPPVITPDDKVDEPMLPDLEGAKIDVKKTDGIDFKQEVDTTVIDDPKGIIVKQEVESDEPGPVQIQARYDGNWPKFLLGNLRPDVPLNNGAPAGKYTVLIQFIVDKEGKISDLKALTSHGYGMEEEAIRVLKRSKDWNPGIQNGRAVKSYHRQPITFEVVSE